MPEIHPQAYQQEFDKINKPPLAIVNEWIKEGLIKWNAELQKTVEDWNANGEPVQPKEDILEFEKLTCYKYCGS